MPDPEPGVATQWLMALTTPLLEPVREAIQQLGVTIEEHVPPSAYVVTATRSRRPT